MNRTNKMFEKINVSVNNGKIYGLFVWAKQINAPKDVERKLKKKKKKPGPVSFETKYVPMSDVTLIKVMSVN
jgi:hypothetical protein